MIRLNLRLKRMFIMWWLLGIWLFLLITPPSYVATYPDLDSRGPVVATVQNNVGTQAMYGHLPSPGTIGQLTAWETGAWLSVLSSVMMVLLFTSFHRKTEANGLAEYVYASGRQRTDSFTAAIATGAIVSAINGAGCTAILLAFRYVSTTEITIAGSVSFGVTISLTMLATMAITSILHSLWGKETNLNRLGLLGVGAAFLIRMVADTASLNWATHLNWISPLGWRMLIAPFTKDSWGVVAALALICVALIALAFVLDSRRLFNENLVHLKQSRQPRQRRISDLYQLNMVLHRGNMIPWSIIIGLIVLIFLPLIDSLLPTLQGDPATMQAVEALMPQGELQIAFIVYIFQMVSILLCVATILPIISLIGQERHGLVDAIRSTGVRRWAPLGGAVQACFSTLSSCTIFAIAGALLGLNIQTSTVENGLSLVLLSSLSIAIHALFFLGIATALAGWFPRFIYLSWLPIIIASAVTLLGPVLSLSDQQMKLSPLTHVWGNTDEAVWPLIMFAVSGFLLIGFGLLGVQRRNLL
ncbi:ABC transporter permease [Corynebacterium suranareeae]|uniref:ABC transporter permease n=1 Tax=Corynebacterium suranareeae TaxID=2506452 RepID=A0A169SBQ5_9CORY|nr:ABC transporter permease [Corynebacterium suranareeae]BAU97389.1 ABC transporter permease [Corynebacterium suranareeae]